MAQHDYVIDNGTGAAVRSDLNGALAAIATINSGATAPTTTYAFQLWADTTTGLLKIRNAANSGFVTVGTLASANLGLLPLTGGTLTGALLTAAGSAATVALGLNDTNTGFYSSGTDEIGIAIGGTLRGFWSSNGLTLQAQNDLRFGDSDSSNWVAFQAPATVASNVTWTLPSADGTANQVLSTNGTGTLSFATALTASGGTITGNLEIGTTGSLTFEGSSADANETTLAVTNPTADRTITLPDATGTVALLGLAQSFSAAQRGAISALSDGATITADFALANNFSVTLAGNRTLANPSNLTAGQSGAIFITQDATGSRTLAYGSQWDFSGGTAPVLTTTANAVDLLVYTVRTTGSIHAQLITNLS